MYLVEEKVLAFINQPYVAFEMVLTSLINVQLKHQHITT